MDNFEPNNRYNLDVENNFVDEETSGLLTEIISRRGLKKDLMAVTGCKRPALNIGKKKRAYQQCLADYQASVTAKGDAVAQAELKVAEAEAKAEESKRQVEELRSSTQTAGGSKSASTDSTGAGAGASSDGKILGMPKGLAIGLGIAILAVGVFVTIKIIRARKKG
jgi:hypothetical protein